MFNRYLFINSVLCYNLVSVTPALDSAVTQKKVNTSQSQIKEKILSEMSWTLKFTLLKEQYNASRRQGCANSACVTKGAERSRRVGLSALVMPNSSIARRQDMAGVEADDNNMKMKLFRLMYETVRDSDLKVKRAELIKKTYTDSPSFEVGYLMGDVTNKFDIMTDISLTLKRLYHEWKPIEHINAYEQIANLAIDVGHISDMIAGFEKKLNQEDENSKYGMPMDSDNITMPGYFQIN